MSPNNKTNIVHSSSLDESFSTMPTSNGMAVDVPESFLDGCTRQSKEELRAAALQIIRDQWDSSSHDRKAAIQDLLMGQGKKKAQVVHTPQEVDVYQVGSVDSTEEDITESHSPCEAAITSTSMYKPLDTIQEQRRKKLMEFQQDRYDYKKKCCWRWVACLVVLLLGILLPAVLVAVQTTTTASAATTASTGSTFTAATAQSLLEEGLFPNFTLTAILQNASSPQALAWNQLQLHPHYDSMPDWRKRQIMALLTLYQPVTSNYEASVIQVQPDECLWFGSSWNRCNNVTGQLERLSLYRRNLQGRLPPEVLFLTSLQTLLASQNQLTGPLPTELGALTALQKLRLEDNQFSGTLPIELLTPLTDLTYLSLQNNPRLSGTIPWSSLSPSLTSLQLHDNPLLIGTIPSQLGILPNLQFLQLQNTSLRGSIPCEKFTANTSLQEIWVNCRSIACPCRTKCYCQD